jgi:hypothetical protein
MNTSKLNIAGISKHMLLYEDALQRNLRHEVIYSKSIDKECTFKPDRITRKSNTSKNTIREVR